MKYIIPLLLIPLALFSYSLKEAIAYKNMDLQKLGAVEAFWIEMEMPTFADSKQQFQDDIVEWFANEQNQVKFMQKLRDCAKQGGLESSPEVIKILQHIEGSLKKWNEVHYSAQTHPILIAPLNKIKINISHVCAMHGRYYEDEIYAENAARQIQSLREEEQEHKEQAKELLIQSGGEAAAAGITFMTGLEGFALYEEIQSVRHLLKSCGEYMEGVECKKEAEALEKQYFPNAEEPKSWWQVWK